MQEADGGFGLLVGQHLRECDAGVVIDSHMEGQEAGMFLLATQAAIGTATDLREARHAFDIEMQRIAGYGMLVALYRGWRIQFAPTAQPGAAQNAAERRPG